MPPKQKGGPLRIVIITTSASGGNLAVANAMKAFLLQQDNIEPIVIDSESVSLVADPIMLATGTHTYDMIYSRMFQKNDDFNEIFDREKLAREIHKYIPSTVMAEFKKTVLALEPDFIISTRSYAPEDLALATLGVPFRMIHDNFEVSLFLNPFYGNIPSDYMRMWMPSFEPSVFKSLFEWHNCPELYNEEDDYEALFQKMSNILYVPVGALKKQFEVLGYPANPVFSQIKDAGELARLRNKWGLKEGDIPVYISMGKYGSGAMRDIFMELSKSSTLLPIKYLFICGNNPSLQQELTLAAKGDERFNIFGLITSSEMNEVMNISRLGIGKTGSATSGETLVTYCPLLIMRYYPWEVANANYLVKMGLATCYDSAKPLFEQLEACLQKDRPVKQGVHPFEEWQEHLMRFIASL